MTNLKELKKKLGAYLETSENIVKKAVSEARALSADETRDLNGLKEKIAGLKATITAAEELLGDSGAEARGLEQYGAGHGDQTEHRGGPFKTLGEQLRAVVSAGKSGSQPDPRLYEVRAASGLNETVGSDGGFLVQTDFSTALLQAGMAEAKLAPRCRPFPIGANSNGVDLPALDETSRVNGSRFGGITLAWGDEAGDISATKPKFRKVALKLKKLTGACYLTDEVVSDSTVLESFVRLAFTSEFGFVIDNAILRGPGAGQPLGILNSGALVPVPKEAGQVGKTILTENIVNMYARQSNPEGAVWLANKDTFPQLSTLTIGVGTAGQIVSVLQQGIAGSPTGMGILGRPILWMEGCSTLGTVGDLMFVDPQRYLLATKGGLQVASSLHVRFLQDEGVMRFIYRVDGSPDTNSAVTPANGTATVSPFVALATRA